MKSDSIRKVVIDKNNLCRGCPFEEKQPKVLPTIPENPLLAVVGMAPGDQEEWQQKNFVGPAGVMLRTTLAMSGIPGDRVAYLNLGRCRPSNDDFESAEWQKAETRCWKHLNKDLSTIPSDVPLLLLGGRPLQRFKASKKLKIGAWRGLWIEAEERRCFVARHPAQILRTQDEAKKNTLIEEFVADLDCMVDRVLGREQPSDHKVTIYESPFEAAEFFAWLAKREKPWTFDIETYDAVAFPSRVGVATDPCHPDFRVRGIAIAINRKTGCWIELMGFDHRKAEVREIMSPAFASPTEKWGFTGHFDEEGLVYTDWVQTVRNRANDGMLGLISLGDGTHDSLRLEKAVVDILGERQYWSADKSKMRDVPLQQVANSAVRDACYTHQLIEFINEKLARGDYL